MCALKALMKSIVMINVRCGGKGWLKPHANLSARGRGGKRQSGWDGIHVRWVKSGSKTRSGCRRRSRTLTSGQRMEISRQLLPESALFSRFWDWCYNSVFPDAGDITVTEQEVVKVGEVLQSQWVKVFDVVYGEAIWSCGKRIAAAPIIQRNNVIG